MPQTAADNRVHQAAFFTVKFQGVEVELGFFASVTGLSSQIDTMEYPEGGQNTFVHKLPSRVKQGNISLKRGVLSSESVLLGWYQQTVVEAKPVTLLVTLTDTTLKPVKTWNFQNAYPVKWTQSDLNASSTEILTETIEVAYNGMTVTAH